MSAPTPDAATEAVRDQILALTRVIADTYAAAEDEIEGLDRAIGDGDHYINLKRGTATIADQAGDWATLPPNEIFQKMAMVLLSAIGGASGPLTASFFMALAKAPEAKAPISVADWAVLMKAGTDAVMARGKSEAGQKTMLDTLIPVSQALRAAAERGATATEVLSELPKVAEAGAQSTAQMMPTKGRAAGLGERALGHVDPGAKSCALIIATVCAHLSSQEPA